MKKELDEQLVQKYPNLYRKRYNSMADTCMCWGFDTCDGWINIIDELSAGIEAEILKLPEHERQFFTAEQVKEKYGTLRFYMSQETEAMTRLIRIAENKSEKTCEVCGKDGIMRGSSWFFVACEEHK